MNFSLSSFLRSCHSERNSLSRWLWNWIAGWGFPNSSGTEMIEKLLMCCFFRFLFQIKKQMYESFCILQRRILQRIDIYVKYGSYLRQQFRLWCSCAAFILSDSHIGRFFIEAEFNSKFFLSKSSKISCGFDFFTYGHNNPPRCFYILILPHFQKAINSLNQKC